MNLFDFHKYQTKYPKIEHDKFLKYLTIFFLIILFFMDNKLFCNFEKFVLEKQLKQKVLYVWWSFSFPLCQKNIQMVWNRVRQPVNSLSLSLYITSHPHSQHVSQTDPINGLVRSNPVQSVRTDFYNEANQPQIALFRPTQFFFISSHFNPISLSLKPCNVSRSLSSESRVGNDARNGGFAGESPEIFFKFI
jgi:hypothetical protein